MSEEPCEIVDELALESEKCIHVGAMIKDKLDLERRTIRWFSEQMNCDRSNMYKLLSRAHLDSNFILRASKVLEYNFFKDIADLVDETTANGWADLFISS